MEKVPSFDKHFISFLLNYICTRPEEMRMQLEDLSKYMTTLPPKCEENLFRKQYGNLKTCMKLPTIETVFFLDSNLVKFQSEEKMKACKDKGIISQADYEKYLASLKIYWTHQLLSLIHI
eukprot:TRINITY_DN3670_c0_g2_i1.p1 TRINITY_DN3670_c0_g2~~TRINITY_DN3670_c0_g2_i1.p1  ORF type:complete len:120 (-),score=25.24 TRINITY_DN3670_c0_g2_i1:5-364(-)